MFQLLMSGNKLKVGGVVSTDQIVNGVVIHKDFHSTPDLKKETEENGHLNCVGAGDQIKPAISQDNFNNNCNNGGGGGIGSPGGVTPDEVTLKMMTSSLDDRIGSQRGYFTLPRYLRPPTHFILSCQYFDGKKSVIICLECRLHS